MFIEGVSINYKKYINGHATKRTLVKLSTSVYKLDKLSQFI